MKSVINHFKGSRDFPRLRIGKLCFQKHQYYSNLLSRFVIAMCCGIILGIGRPPGKMDTANFVLRPFTKQEHEEVCKPLTFAHRREIV